MVEHRTRPKQGSKSVKLTSFSGTFFYVAWQKRGGGERGIVDGTCLGNIGNEISQASTIRHMTSVQATRYQYMYK